MTNEIIISLCVLLLIAYVFNVTSSKTKIPSVILLLLLGWLVKQVTINLNIQLPDFAPLLPIIGTIGLILIVLEGSLELEINRAKVSLIKKSFIGALAPMLLLSSLLAFVFYYYGGYNINDSFINAIPFFVISSAIAIPSAENLSSHNKEFVIYESSLSDIIGVLLFNFFALNETIGFDSIIHFVLQIFIMMFISVVATAALSLLLSKIDHPIKFVPIILLIILIYTLSKIYHLPALIFILLFGLSINNLEHLRKFKWIKLFKPDVLDKEVNKFRELTIEGTFIIRSLFFLLFGYLIDSNEILDVTTLPWAVAIVFFTFLVRSIQLKASKITLKPLLYIAPKGLITVLLFLSIEPSQTIPIVNKSLILQVIILSALVMMFGLMTHKSEKKQVIEPHMKQDGEIITDPNNPSL
jgi:Kef-type K+ transport system membrane component KefB